MMYALGVLLLIAVNVHGQKEECTLATELIKVYQDFHNERFKPPRYLTVIFRNDMYPKAKEELIEPGKYTKEKGLYKSTTGSMDLPKDDTSPIEKKVEKVLRRKFVRQLVKLTFHHPMKFACAGILKDVGGNRQNLEITCLYTRDRND